MTYEITVHALHLLPGDIFSKLPAIARELAGAGGPADRMLLEDGDQSRSYAQKYDLLWKWVLEDVFDDFLAFFFPEAHKLFDLERGFEWLDKELEQLFPPENELFRARSVDKLVKVFKRDGEEESMLIHVEVQGYKEDNFPYRMFQYFSCIFDKHQKPITAFAIFTDNNMEFRPDRFEIEYQGTKLVYTYNTFKILEQDEAELEKSMNPFALVALIVKQALKAKKLTPVRRYEQKVGLMKLLFSKKFSIKKTESILVFLEYYIRINDNDLDQQFEAEKELLTKGRKQPMGIKERVMEMLKEEAAIKGREQGMAAGRAQGMAEGRAEGRAEGKKQVVKNLIVQLALEDQQIAKLAEVSVPFVKEIRASLQ